MQGTVVRTGKSARKLGKISHAIFHPSEPRVVGFLVSRSDIALMIKRSDVFIAFDSLTEVDDFLYVASEAKDATGKQALARLGVDLDKCSIWKGLPIVTDDGEEVGKVGDVIYDEATGAVDHVSVYSNAVDKAVKGQREIPLELVLGIEDIKLIVGSDALGIEQSEGLAEKAGSAIGTAKVAAAKAGRTISEKAPKVASKAGSAAQTGAYKLGRQLGKTKGMFSSFKEEFEKGMRGDE